MTPHEHRLLEKHGNDPVIQKMARVSEGVYQALIKAFMKYLRDNPQIVDKEGYVPLLSAIEMFVESTFSSIGHTYDKDPNELLLFLVRHLTDLVQSRLLEKAKVQGEA